MGEEYFCPNCGASLNDQPGFDPSTGVWRCRVCGMQLMDESVSDGELYDDVAWFCDECGALLNRQEGFSDLFEEWECEECGYINEISEDVIEVPGPIH